MAIVAPPLVVTLTVPPEPELDGSPPNENRPNAPPPEPAKPPTLWAKMPIALSALVEIAPEFVTWTAAPDDAAAPSPPVQAMQPPTVPPAPPAAPTLCAQMPTAPLPVVESDSVLETFAPPGAPPCPPSPPLPKVDPKVSPPPPWPPAPPVLNASMAWLLLPAVETLPDPVVVTVAVPPAPP